MQFKVRQECPDDYLSVAEAIKSAYRDVSYSDHQEQFMVARLRNTDAFIPQLSLVAEVDGKIVGHVLLTKMLIHGAKKSVVSLALGPLSVIPQFHSKGIGSGLVLASHRLAKELGYSSVIVLGPGEYYARFGYERTKEYGVVPPFDVREENCRIFLLNEDVKLAVSGRVEYHPSWWNNPSTVQKTS